jgi:hypothetical protein
MAVKKAEWQRGADLTPASAEIIGLDAVAKRKGVIREPKEKNFHRIILALISEHSIIARISRTALIRSPLEDFDSKPFSYSSTNTPS